MGSTVGTDYQNASSATYVAWNWKAGGAPTADNDNTTGAMDANSVSLNGSLQAAYTPEGSPSIYPSKMSINTTNNLSIIEYTGTGSAATLPHGLGVKPSMILIKKTNAADSWAVWAKDLAGDSTDNAVKLDTSAGYVSGDSWWNGTDPTTSLIHIGTNGATNGSTDTFICYVFADTEGYLKAGNYNGNGDNDGTFVYTGFRPMWIMTKCSTETASWLMTDSVRFPYNVTEDPLFANENSAETNSSTYAVDILSNGFKCRGVNNNTNNSSGDPYVYLAFAESPFKYSNAR